MSDSRLQDVLRVLDPPPGRRPWHGGASPLGSLRGVGARQAAWRPAAGRHTIWELVLHLAYWKYNVRRRIEEGPVGAFPRTPSDWPAMPAPADDAAWAKDRALLREEHRKLVRMVRSFDPSRLDDSPGDSTWTYADLIVGVVTHDTYHTGQVQLMKRLWDSRSSRL